MLLTYISLPVIAALIGWITNYIAVKMLFRPRRPVFGIQGLVPKRQREIAASIGETVERDLLTREDIMKLLGSPEVEAAITKLLGEKVELLTGKLAEKNPMVAMFLQGELAVQVKSALLVQLQEMTPQVLASILSEVEEKLDFKEIVRQKVEGFDLSRLESIIQRISARELRAIELLGGVLGFLVGLVQVGIMMFSR